MLPAAARLTRSQEFSLVVRRGRRAGRSRLVAHVLVADATAHAAEVVDSPRHGGQSAKGTRQSAPTRERPRSTRVGFVVSKAVGNAVVRHRVTRRLRHLMRERLPLLPAGTLVVIRALPPAASATSNDLGADLDSAFRKLRVLPAPDGNTATDSA